MKKIFTLILAALAISLGASADETSLRDQLVGLYSGSAQGGDYSTPPSYDWVNLAFNYGEDGNKLVDVAAGEADNEVVFTNFFPAMEGFEESGMVGKVTANTDYAGYLGYITFSTQTVGKFNDKEVTLKNMSYSWALSTDDIELWIKEDGSLSMGTYACLRYPGEEYEMYLCYVYADLSPVGYTAADVELATKIAGNYKGSAQGGDYSTPPSYDWVNLAFNYGEDGHKLVNVAASEYDNEVLFTNFFPEMEGYVDEGMVGKVTANTDYAGYLGYITFSTQTVGKFNDKEVTLKNMSYSWALSTDDIELWIKEDGSLSMGTYACLRYPGEEYEMYLCYVYADLSPDESGVQGIAADMTTVNNAPVEYFSINGMRVNGNNLVPGLYIKRQGTQVTKVIVK
jgi:hypothetical protein